MPFCWNPWDEKIKVLWNGSNIKTIDETQHSHYFRCLSFFISLLLFCSFFPLTPRSTILGIQWYPMLYNQHKTVTKNDILLKRYPFLLPLLTRRTLVNLSFSPSISVKYTFWKDFVPNLLNSLSRTCFSYFLEKISGLFLTKFQNLYSNSIAWNVEQISASV